MSDVNKLKQLRINIREEQYPYFTSEELEFLLEKNNQDVDKTSYECLIIKSEETGLNVSGLTTKDSSRYFKSLASKYVQTNTGVLK